MPPRPVAGPAGLALEIAPYDDPRGVRFVAPAHRRRGLARAVLAELERTALAADCHRTVLETGTRQPEARAFYEELGYEVIPRFGVYRDEPSSVCYARVLDGGRPRARG